MTPRIHRPASIPVPKRATPAPQAPRRESAPVPTDSTLVVAVAKGSADTLYTAPPGGARRRLNGLTVTNILAPGSYVQTFVGILREAAASSSDWQPVVSPYLNGGDPAFTWYGEMYLGEGDQLVAYADTTNRASVSFAIDEVY